MTDCKNRYTTLSDSAMTSLISGISEDNKIKLYELLENTLQRYYVITYSMQNKETNPVKIQLETFYWNEVETYLKKYDITADDDPRGSHAYNYCFGYWIDPLAIIALHEECTEQEVLDDSYFTKQIAEVPEIKLCGYAKHIPNDAHGKYVFGIPSMIIIKTDLNGIKKITDSLWESTPGFYDM